MKLLECLVVFVMNPFRFPVGLIKIWLDERRKKTFSQILNEYDMNEICGHGSVTFLNIIAALGALMVLLLIVATIIGIFRNGFTH
jgi:hypothetical protein